MKRTNIILVFLSILIGALVATSCSKDHDIPTGKVFNADSGGGSAVDSLTISVSAHPSEGGTVTGGGKYQKGKTCVVAASANEGYVFSNWTENGTQVSTSVSYSFTVDADRTLVANFSVSTGNNFTITAVASPEYGGVISGSGSYQQGQACTVTATAQAGYTFVNWTENGNQVSTEASYTFTVTGNRTLVANFTLCDYSNIILNELNGDTKFIEIYNKGTSDIPLNGMYIMKDDYVAGATWTADATVVAPAHGYVLLYSVDVAADYSEQPENLFFNSGLSAKKTVRITLFMPDGTMRDEFTRGTTGEWGQTISTVEGSYARTPDGGDWKLANPTPGEANPSTGEDIPDAETPVNYTINVSANLSDGGTVQIMSGGTSYGTSHSFAYGTIIQLIATANSGYSFTYWKEGNTVISTTATTSSITVDGAHDYTAYFSAQTTDQTFTVNGVSFTMKRVEGGTFWMGAQSTNPSGQNYDSEAYANEFPEHSVTLSTFYMGETEVTQELWQAVMGSNPSYFSGTNLPVEQVSWNMIVNEFLPALNAATGQNFRLPTEAEWEYAARGGNQGHGYKYAGSNTVGNVAWYSENSNSQTHPVATKLPNELGLYDMSGNVWEWCSDWYGNYYSSDSQTNPQGPSSGSGRVLRGGSWFINARNCRVSARTCFGPVNADDGYGFRLALPQ